MIGDINKDFIYRLVLGDGDINWTLQLQKTADLPRQLKAE